MSGLTSPVILRVVANAVRVVGRAGKVIKDIMNSGDLGVVEKAVNDLQTEADRSAQRCIVASLSKQFPKLTIIGEETLDDKAIPNDWVVTEFDEAVFSEKCPDKFSRVKEEDVVVWVDPLDGTKEYTQGLLDHVTILVGIAVGGSAIAGVIHQPYYNYKNEPDVYKQGRTMWGIVGLGVRGITPVAPPAGKRIITTTRSHGTAMTQAVNEAMKADEILKVGGAGHKVLLLIEGRAHAYVFPSPGCKKWDTCAPEAILVAAGGALSDIHGDPIQYHATVDRPNSCGVMATAIAEDLPKYLALVPEEAKKALPKSRI